MATANPRAAATSATTATQRVYDGLYAAILEHRLSPGTRLREAELATQFAVSRTVVRQALQRLAQDQVIVLHHNRGAQVPEPTREDAAHVFDARRIVECEIARRLAGRLSGDQLGELRALVEAEAAADARGDRPAAIRLSGQFHRALAQMAGNPVFVRLLDELLPSTSMLLALYPPQPPAARPPLRLRAGCAAHRHVELIEALSRHGSAAATEMRRHLQELERSLHFEPPPADAADAVDAADAADNGAAARDPFLAYRAPVDAA